VRPRPEVLVSGDVEDAQGGLPTRRWVGWIWPLLFLPTASGAGDTPLNLYEWMATAPVVVGARVQDDDQRISVIEVVQAVRGEVKDGDTILLDVRRANRDRELFEPRLKLKAGRTYLMLLKPREKKKGGTLPYFLVRGIQGAREVPAEGAALYLDAASRFAKIQDSHNESLVWTSFRQMLEEVSPVLIETSLDQFLKFQRESVDLIPLLRPLLDHPRPDLRQRALRLAGRVLERHPSGEIPDQEDLESEIIGHARRDSSVDVRIAATHALKGLPGPSILDILESISHDDPEQSVRYAAELLLHERNEGAEENSIKAGSPRDGSDPGDRNLDEKGPPEQSAPRSSLSRDPGGTALIDFDKLCSLSWIP